MNQADADRSVSAARRRGDAALAGHAGDEPAARALLAVTDPEVRATAYGALVRMARATAADAASALTDPDPIVRRYACELGTGLPGANFASLLLSLIHI